LHLKLAVAVLVCVDDIGLAEGVDGLLGQELLLLPLTARQGEVPATPHQDRIGLGHHQDRVAMEVSCGTLQQSEYRARR
jgi:hypothetical protein